MCAAAAAVCLLYNMQVFGSWQIGGVVYGSYYSNIQLSLCSVTGTSASVRAPCMRSLLCAPAVWMSCRMLSLNVLSSSHVIAEAPLGVAAAFVVSRAGQATYEGAVVLSGEREGWRVHSVPEKHAAVNTPSQRSFQG